MNREQIDALVSEAQGMSIQEKVDHYSVGIKHWHRDKSVPQHLIDMFCNDVRDKVFAANGWNENPPIWYHGGPPGLKAGDELLSWPRVPSVRKTLAENRRAKLGLIRERYHRVYFTNCRTTALRYCHRRADGKLYRVQPEGEIELDPHTFFLAGIAQRDPEITDIEWFIRGAAVLWRAPTVRVVRPG